MDNAFFSFFKDFGSLILPISIGLAFFIQGWKYIFNKDGVAVRGLVLIFGVLFSGVIITSSGLPGTTPAGLKAWELYAFWAKLFVFGFGISLASMLEYWGVKQLAAEFKPNVK